VKRYKRALLELEPTMAPRHRELLVAHYRAHRHTSNATQLAKLVGYKRFSSVNLQYGKLGQKLTAALKWKPPQKAQASYSIASFYPPSIEHRDWEWHMHPELAQALRELGWVK
jgi:hypothetical protein